MKAKHDKQQLTKQLLQWYDENKRILPWREHPTPYAVWVSEIMLQQTRVEAVKPYFERFMKTLPDMYALAHCPDDDLAKLWEGLGYYHRVRNMKKCAQICVAQYDGNLPADYEQLLALPGIGAYTAGAIASIAYQIPVCAVDGNVLRVFSRVLGSEDDITKTQTKKNMQAIIQEYIPKRCDAFNQALMEIGALICIPNGAPHCDICPIQSECVAYRNGDQQRLPIKSPKQKRRIEVHTVAVILCDHRVHLIKRADQGLLAGLYQFDFFDGDVSRDAVSQYAKQFGTIQEIHPLPPAKHIFTHKEWHMNGWLIILTSHDENPINQTQGIWATVQELQHTYALPGAFQVYKEVCFNVLKGEITHESTLI